MKHPCPSTSVQDLYATLCQSGETSITSTHLMSPYYTERRPSHNLMYTVDHTFTYSSEKFLCACAESSMHAHTTKSDMQILKLPLKMIGNGFFATVYKGAI